MFSLRETRQANKQAVHRAGKKVGDLNIKDAEAALDIEDSALTSIHLAADKQLKRLQMEEQLLKLMLDRAEESEPQEPGAERVQERDGGGGAPSDGREAGNPSARFSLREHLQQAPGFQPFPRQGGRRDEGGPGPSSTAAAAVAAATSSESE